MINKAIILLLCIFLVGCSSTAEWWRDSEGRIYKVELKGPQEIKVITNSGETISGKTTVKIIPENLINVLK